MRWLDDIEALEALYGAASANSLRKVARRMTPAYRQWIAASRFVVVASVGPEGTDASPRGDDGPVVLELDPGDYSHIVFESSVQLLWDLTRGDITLVTSLGWPSDPLDMSRALLFF